MRIPHKYSNLVFSILLSVIMVTIISGSVLVINQGLRPGLASRWLSSFATAWPIAFVSLLIVAPRVRKIVAYLTRPIDLRGESGRAG